MKKITLLITFLLIAVTGSYAQVSAYAFSQSNGAYTAIAGGTVLGATTSDDQRFVDPVTPLGGTITTGVGFPIGFTITYNGLAYDRFAVNNNGWISLGQSALGVAAVNMNASSSYTSLSSTVTTVSNDLVARIAGFARDLQGQAGGELRFETIGTAPNRTLVVQWSNYRRFNVTVDNLNFQIRLNETTNVVDVVYGAMTTASATLFTGMSGLRAAPNTPATNFNSRTTTTNWAATTPSATAAGTMSLSATILPVSGLTFSWTPPSCNAPAGLTASAITTTTATVTWAATTGNYEYVLDTNAANPAGSGTVLAGETYNATLLTPSTTYYFHVRSVCAGPTYSPWSTVSFTTLCNPYTIPYFEGFEAGYTHNTPVAGCLSQETTTGTGVWTANASLITYNRTPRTGTWNAFVQWSNEDWIFIPINLIGGTSYTASLFARQDGATATDADMTISYGTAANAASMTNAIVATTGIINGGYQQIAGAFTPATTGTYYVGIKGFMNSTPFYISLDDISIDITPSCLSPLGLVASAITDTSATTTWTATTGNYEYVLDTNAADPAGSGTVLAGETYNATLLTPSTTYYFHVRSVCAGPTYSTWSTVSFTTACAPVTAFTENFDGVVAPAFPNCWARVGTGGNANIQTTSPSSGINTMYLYSSSTTSLGVVKTVPVSNLGAGTHRLNFNMRANFTAGDDVEIGYLTDPNNDASFVALSSVNAASLVYAPYTFSPPAGIYSNYLAFRHTGTIGASVLIDDVVWEPIPACVNVIGLAASAITSTTATTTWTATTGNYEYVLDTNAADPAGSGTVLAGETYNATLLTPSTTYYFHVRTVCAGPSYSTWSTVLFTTACAPYTIPYFEGFEAGYTHNTPVAGCLTQETTTGTGVWTANASLTTYNRAPRTGTWNAFLQYGNEDWIFIPINLIGGTSYTASLFARQDDVTVTDADMTISYGTVANAASMTNAIVTATGIINGGYQQIAGSFTPASTGTYYVGIKGFMNATPWYISLDDISIDVTPACSNPLGLAASAITSTSATTTWTATTGNYEYVLDTNAADPAGSGTVLAGETYNATLLTPSTTYYFHVRSVCAGPTYSPWSTISFTTVATPPVNDDCSAPIALTLGGIYTDQDIDTTNLGGTLSAETPIPTCGNFNFATTAKDVWYSVIVPSSGTLTIETDVTTAGTGLLLDPVTQVYSGTCGALVAVGCDDSSGNTTTPAGADYSKVILTAQTPGATLLVRTFGYNGLAGNFSISAYDASLSTRSFDATGFSAYPNPVKDVLNLSYTKEISSVSVHNLLGQEVMTKSINATQSKIDMSNLSNGTYLVKVTVDGLVKTIKVVKQ